MEIDALLTSRGDENPSGEDMVYELAFMTLEVAAQPGEERQAGDQIIAAEEPDYREVTTAALEVMEASHDLRAGVYLSHSELRLRGFEGLADGTRYLRGCLEDFWDTCHPQLDAEDDDDPTGRVNAMLSLAAPETMLRGVRLAPLTRSKTFGSFSLRDIAIAEGNVTPSDDEEEIPDSAAIGAAFQDTDQGVLASILEAAQEALENVQAINAKFDEEIPGQGPDLDPLSKLLKQAVARLKPEVGEVAEEAPETGGEAVDEVQETAEASGGGGGGAIRSPNDVQMALDRIIAYYARYEPSSPLPLLLQRAKKLVSADFLTIVKDMAPDGIGTVNTIGGLEQEEY